MWPSISDMSRDECRKCLRCLELDAYGNMVSVLRAQGPFTDEKRKLLGELAKVLHISNERHRAEIRRAVNDEKLSVIAEQLNGPNTCTDWAIEGRRTIPLLPRLKAHTAFTGLANSLSLVIAAANEKKLSSSNRVKDPMVKTETASREDTEMDDRSMAKLPILHTDINARGKKRKRSTTGSSDNDKCRKAQSTETKARDTEANSLSPVDNGVASPLLMPNREKELTKVVQVSIVTPSTTVHTTRRNDKTLESTSINVSNHHKLITEPSISPNSDETNSIVDMRNIDPANRQDISNDINGQRSVTAQTVVSKSLQFEEKKESHVDDDNFVDDTTQTQEVTKISRPDSTTPGTPCPKRLITTNFCVTTKPIITSSTNCVMAVNSGSTASCGPGPPCVTPSSTLTYKKLPTSKLNHQSGTKMGITLNSSKTLKINAHPNARLATKANVIVVQKGSSRGVTLSHGGKEVLGKVIMGGKNLCLSSQKSEVALLPHRAEASSNGEQQQQQQTLTTLNANHTDSLKLGAKAGNMILLDIRQEVLDKNPVLSKFLEVSGTLNNDSTSTAGLKNSNDARESITNNRINDTSRSIVTKSPKTFGMINGLDVELSEKRETPKDDCSSLYEILGNSNSSELTDNRKIMETFEEKIDIHGILDAQTGIYNYETADGIIIEDRTEESIETSCIDIFSTALDSPDINLDNLQYVNDDEDQEIVIETIDSALDDDDSQFREIAEQLDDS